MNIIKLEPSATGSRPPIQSWSGPVPAGYIEVPDAVDASAMQTHMGFVGLTIDENGVLTGIMGNDEAYQAYAATIPDPLPEAKAQRIQQSKDDLEAYLEAHPLTWTDGQQYSITREKQQQLTSKILSATVAAQTATPYDLTWNATGEECSPWSLENLAALAFAIDTRVTALVSYQQAQEVAMREAVTLEALEAIEVDYDTVQ